MPYIRLFLFCVCMVPVVTIPDQWAGAAERPSPAAQVEQPKNQEIDRAVQLTWSEFCDRLRANDVEGALAHFSEYARPQFTPTFRALGTQLHKISEGWSAIRLADVLGDYAMYYLTSTNEGRTTSHFVTFARAGDGKWYVESM